MDSDEPSSVQLSLRLSPCHSCSIDFRGDYISVTFDILWHSYFFPDMFTKRDIEDLIRESEKMMKFNHPNILNLIGVCIDAGEAPYIVMPFMANGSLLVHLRKSRPHLTISEEAGEEMV